MPKNDLSCDMNTVYCCPHHFHQGRKTNQITHCFAHILHQQNPRKSPLTNPKYRKLNHSTSICIVKCIELKTLKSIKAYLESCKMDHLCFHPPSKLKKRLIDIRIFLSPWVKYYYSLRLKYRQQSQFYPEIPKGIITQRDALFVYLHGIADCFYAFTQGNDVSEQQLVRCVDNYRQTQMQNIDSMVQLVDRFNGSAGDIAIVKVIGQAREANLAIALREVLLYLYFEGRQANLSMDPQTDELEIKKEFSVSVRVLNECVGCFKRRIKDVIDGINEFVLGVLEDISERPQIRGHKQGVVESNALAQAILGRLHSIDLSAFYVVEEYIYGGKKGQLVQKVRERYFMVQREFWKKYFDRKTIEKGKNDEIEQQQNKVQKWKNKLKQYKKEQIKQIEQSRQIQNKEYGEVQTSCNQTVCFGQVVHRIQRMQDYLSLLLS